MMTNQRKQPASRLATALATVTTLATLTTGIATACPPAATNEPSAQQRYDVARNQYEIGHFQVAFAEFATLADSGHCSAARMALQMLRDDKSMYASEFRVPREREQRWQHQTACDHTPVRR